MKLSRLAMLPAVLAALTIPAASVAVPGPIEPSDVDDPLPTYAVRNYEPLSRRVGETYGWMQLSNHSLVFSGLNGHMELQLWGIEPEKETDELSGAHIFHVINAKAFVEANKDNPDFSCNPPNWFIVHKVNNDYPYTVPGEVLVILLDADDIFEISWNKNLCTKMIFLIDTAKEYPFPTGAIPRR